MAAKIKHRIRVSFYATVEGEDEKQILERLKDIRRRIVYENSMPTLVTNGRSSFSFKRTNKKLTDVKFAHENSYRYIL